MDKFCVYCKYFNDRTDTGEPRPHPRCNSLDRPREPVRGARIILECRIARHDEMYCGYAGRWFQDKEDRNG